MSTSPATPQFSLLLILKMLWFVLLLPSTGAAQTLLPPGSWTSGTVTTGEMKHYYVDVSSEAVSLAVEVRGDAGDIDLYLKKDSPPATGNWDYSSRSPSSNELIRLGEGTTRPLTQGRWFVGVYGYTGAPYEVRASLGLPLRDISGDGTISLYDAAQVRAVLLGEKGVSALAQHDSNNDQVMDTADFVAIRQNFDPPVVAPRVYTFSERQVTLLSSSADTLTVRKNNSGNLLVQSGDILYREGSDPLARLVESIEPSGTSFILHTLNASLSDVYASGSFLVASAATRSSRVQFDASGLSVDIAGAATVTLTEAILDFSPDIDFEWSKEMDGSIFFRCVAKVEQSALLAVEAEFNLDPPVGTFEKTIPGSKITRVFPNGVVFEGDLVFEAKLLPELEGCIEGGARSIGAVSMGVEVDAPQGATPRVKRINRLDFHVSSRGLSGSMGGKIECAVVPRVAVKLFGIGGLEGRIRPFFGLRGRATSNGQCDIDLSVGATLGAALVAKVFYWLDVTYPLAATSSERVIQSWRCGDQTGLEGTWERGLIGECTKTGNSRLTLVVAGNSVTGHVTSETHDGTGLYVSTMQGQISDGKLFLDTTSVHTDVSEECIWCTYTLELELDGCAGGALSGKLTQGGECPTRVYDVSYRRIN